MGNTSPKPSRANKEFKSTQHRREIPVYGFRPDEKLHGISVSTTSSNEANTTTPPIRNIPVATNSKLNQNLRSVNAPTAYNSKTIISTREKEAPAQVTNPNITGASKSAIRSTETFACTQSKRDDPTQILAPNHNCRSNATTDRNNDALTSTRGNPSQANSRSKQNLPNARVPSEATKSRDSSPVAREVLQDTISSSNQNLKDKTQSSNFNRGRKNRQEFRLFLGGLPDNITETKLKAVFETFGAVSDIIIAQDKATNKSKRYGFLGFEDKNSYEECLKRHFIFIDGRRIEVKKAWPKEEKDGKKGWKKKNDGENSSNRVKDFEKLTNSSAASSSDSKSNSKEFPLPYQKIFDDYFKAKFVVQNLLNSGKRADVPFEEQNKSEEQDREKELEKWLAGLSVSTNRGNSQGYYADFSSDSDESDLEQYKLISKYEEEKESITENDVSDQQGQMETSFQTYGQLGCAVCQWAPSNNSFEDLLAHCKKPLHRQKLKERFKADESQNKTSNKNDQAEKQDHDQQKKRTKTGGRSKSRNRSNMIEPSVGSQNSQDSQENKNDIKSILAEIMTSIEVKSEKCIRCKMCNKNIPPSEDIQVLMKNLSHHLQSKSHLKKILKCEKSFQKSGTEAEIKTDIKADTQNTKSNKLREAEKINAKSLSLAQLESETLDTKVTLLCLPCNYFSSKPKKFLAHLNSESHFNYLKEKWFSEYPVQNIALEQVRQNITNCASCERYLFGSNREIENHFSRCKFLKFVPSCMFESSGHGVSLD